MGGLNRVMIAAPSSGSGKTIFTLGLLNLLKEKYSQREMVSAFKCGPDYIDPMFHRTVIGVPSENLDSFFLKDKGILEVISTIGGDLSVIEGVMGIYDGMNVAGLSPEMYTNRGSGGIDSFRKGSCYEIAAITKTPIILVVDCKGLYTTVLSIVKGILLDDTNRLIRGIVFNRTNKVTYDSIEPLANAMIEEMGLDVKALGFIPNSPKIRIDSRHLGLKLPSEIDNLRVQVNHFSDLIKDNCDVASIVDIMKSAEMISPANYNQDSMAENLMNGTIDKLVPPGKLRLGIARDQAFCFYYEENLRIFGKQGIEIIEFSPLHDKKLPQNIQGILLGGGYPELYAKELSENTSMKDSIRDAINNGLPSLAECGGFMYLMDEMEGIDKSIYPMIGVIPGSSRNNGRLTRFGYVNITKKPCDKEISEKGHTLIDTGMVIKGHEFHYYDSTNNGEECSATKPNRMKSWNCIHMGNNYLWGYPHLYYASCPELITNFRRAMERYSKDNGLSGL